MQTKSLNKSKSFSTSVSDNLAQRAPLLEASLEQDEGSMRFCTEIVEQEYRVFVQPHVPGSMAVIYLALFLFLAIVEVTQHRMIADGHTVAAVMFLLYFIATGVGFVMQLVLKCKDNEDLPVERKAALVSYSDKMFAIIVVCQMIYELGPHLTFGTPQACANYATNVVELPWGKVYRDARCFKILVPFSPCFLIFMVLRRQLFVNVAKTSIGCVVATIIVVAAFGPGSPVSSTTLALTVFWVAGMASFAAFVRRQIEDSERKYFVVYVQLMRRTVELQKRNQELELHFASLVPTALLNRTSVHRVVDGIVDETSHGVVAVVSIHDFASLQTANLPMTIATLMETFTIDFAEALENSRGLHRVGILHDEFVYTANVISPTEPSVGVVAAAEGLLQIISSTAVPLCGAIHVGQVVGGFVGKSKVHYDVFGEGVTICRVAARASKTANRLLITEDAVQLARDAMTIDEGPTIEHGGFTLQLKAVHQVMPLEDFQKVRNGSQSDVILIETDFNSAERNNYELSMREKSSTDSNWAASRSNSNPNPLERLTDMRAETKNATEEDTLYETRTTWCLFDTFVDESVENDFVTVRAVTMAQRAQRVLVGYAWFQLMLIVILLADWYPEANGITALFIMLLSLVFTIVLATYAKTVAESACGHTVWSTTALVVPLVMLLGASLGRPGSVGLDPLPLTLVGALVRAPCFKHARHQLVAIPLFLLLAQFQVVLPGGVLQGAAPLIWLFVFYTIVADARNDRIQRRQFIAEGQMQRVLAALDREKNVRDGLVRLSTPANVVEAWRAGLMSEQLIVFTVPETIVAVVSSLPSPHQSPVKGTKMRGRDLVEQRSKDFSKIEAASVASGMDIVKVFGDVSVLATPIVTYSIKTLSPLEAKDTAVYVTSLLELGESHGVLMDIDSSFQVVCGVPLPRHTTFGVVITRLLTLEAGGALGRGLQVTDQAARMVRLTHDILQESGINIEETQQPPLRMRGVGLMHLVALRNVNTN